MLVWVRGFPQFLFPFRQLTPPRGFVEAAVRVETLPPLPPLPDPVFPRCYAGSEVKQPRFFCQGRRSFLFSFGPPFQK